MTDIKTKDQALAEQLVTKSKILQKLIEYYLKNDLDTLTINNVNVYHKLVNELHEISLQIVKLDPNTLFVNPYKPRNND